MTTSIHGIKEYAIYIQINLKKVGRSRIVLGDEFSPDGCRLWDKDTKKKLDKDRFRQGLGGVVEAYEEVAARLGINLDNI